MKKNEFMSDEEAKKVIAEGKIIIRQTSGYSFHNKQRNEILKNAFNSRYKCLKCKKKKDLQIHHIYSFAPKDIIDNYDDFLEIPWVPLCKSCHMIEHGVEHPDETEDD